MGNICRSPSAEAVFRTLSTSYIELLGLQIDSCGTIGHHVGEPADQRSVSAAKNRGYDLSSIRSRKIKYNDLEYYDLILAMDLNNLKNIKKLDVSNLYHDKIKLFLEFSDHTQKTCVPDPYYGGESGFDHVIDLIENASRGLINILIKT